MDQATKRALMIGGGVGLLGFLLWALSSKASTAPAPSPAPTPTPQPVPPPPAKPQPPAPKSVVQTNANNGGTVSLRKGDTLQVQLDAMGSDDYRWNFGLSGSPNVLQLQGVNSAPTSSGHVEFANYKAVGDGLVTIGAAFQRPGESPIEFFNLHVQVG